MKTQLDHLYIPSMDKVQLLAVQVQAQGLTCGMSRRSSQCPTQEVHPRSSPKSTPGSGRNTSGERRHLRRTQPHRLRHGRPGRQGSRDLWPPLGRAAPRWLTAASWTKREHDPTARIATAQCGTGTHRFADRKMASASGAMSTTRTRTSRDTSAEGQAIQPQTAPVIR